MKIHEYQARAILQSAGVPVPGSEVIDRGEQAADAFRKVGAKQVVVKAQVHAGGRGKAGYVKLVTSGQEAAEHATRMLSVPMVSKQTGPQGVKVNKVLLAAAVD